MGYIGRVTGNMVIGMMLPGAMLVTLSALSVVWRIRTARMARSAVRASAGS